MASSHDQLYINVTSSSSSAKATPPKRKWPSFKERRAAKRSRLKEAELQAVAPPSAKPQEVSSARVTGGGGGENIKTSSLFKHNPDIPKVQRAEVRPLTEKIFTSQSFSDLNLHPHLVATLNKVLHVSTLTSVQKASIPPLLSGRDAVVRSQTGSGKTLSFAVPVVQSLQALQTKVQRSDGPLALVIVPTRELAQQTFATFQKLLKPFTWIVPGVLTGGEKRKSEKARLRKGINVLVSTPGRLVDHIKHTLSIAFGAVRWLVLDEADRILDLGFEKDLSIIFNSLNAAGAPRQNVLLSATLTQGVTRLADVCLKDPVDVRVHDPDPDSAPALRESFALPTGLEQFAVVVPSKVRLVCLAAFLLHTCRDKKALVFVSSCEEVDFLHALFRGVLSADGRTGLRFLRLHGNMPQEERCEVFRDFSSRGCGVLLCTDVAARGLHLPQVAWIIQVSAGALEQESRERATVLQTHFENFVHADATSLRDAKKALVSYLRSYASYPSRLKRFFHIRALHLGHAAKSFGLRDAPRRLAAAEEPRLRRRCKGGSGANAQNKPRPKTTNDADEFSSGLQIKKEKRKREEAELQ
ncbi:probable ATP-dependent RNA helicase DDX31 isoform X3 [Syngnathoides biaculeatus]|uniref:probable ATP-dependent RNA helicase DDX31 isoform X3 n=1 Tax=Syngnathoides biaculeatus TaxID=300417 RepID=UPI002ADE6379|nr:probable ATP-dependent RNA helicase DDX31 isoform X3 [Syngnathoides biaculeatus]